MNFERLHIPIATQKDIFHHYAALLKEAGTALPEKYQGPSFYCDKMIDGYLIHVEDLMHKSELTNKVLLLDGGMPFRLQQSTYYTKVEYSVFTLEELDDLCVRLEYIYDTWKFISISEMNRLMEHHEHFIVDTLTQLAMDAISTRYHTSDALDVDFESIFKSFEKDQQ